MTVRRMTCTTLVLLFGLLVGLAIREPGAERAGEARAAQSTAGGPRTPAEMREELADIERGTDDSVGGLLEPDLVTVDEDERNQVRTDLANLATAWADAGGRNGFSFWEKELRRYDAGLIAASTLRDYTISYRDVLRDGRDRLEERGVRTDGAHVIRDRLVRAADERLDALDTLASYLEARYEDAGRTDRERMQERFADFYDNLQASYRSTRLAMNAAQAMLEANGQERLQETAFL